MEITLEQCFASAVRYIQDVIEEERHLYFDEIPEDFVVPSLFFPVPVTNSRKVTLSTYRTYILFEVHCMASKNWQANVDATAIRDSILLNGCVVPIVAEDGTVGRKGFRVTEPTITPGETGIVRVSFMISDYFSKDESDVIKADNIYFSRQVLDAWQSATADLGESEG